MAKKRKAPPRDSSGRFKKPDDAEKQEGAADEPAFPAWVKKPAEAFVTAVITASGLLTFVAAVGGAIVWVRFYSAELPASQALAALPRGELIASGAVLLAAFMFVGALAALGVYLFDRDTLVKGGDNVMMALVGLVAVEAVVVITLAIDSDWARRLVAAEVAVLLALAAILVLRKRARPPAARSGGQPTPGPIGRDWARVGYALAVLLPAAGAEWLLNEVGSTRPPSGAEADYREEAVVLGAVLLAAVLVAGWHWVVDRTERQPPAKLTAADPRLRAAMAFVTVLALAFVAAPAAILWQSWIAVALATAVLLAFVCMRVARTAKRYKVMWCSIAVFMSVPLLGAVAGIARNVADPQVQPVAFIRKEDGVDEAVQGIYVTETKDRLYFANVATDGCSDILQPRSGRLLWVPRAEVVTMALGPPQSVEDAGQSALEMYYALAPRALAGSTPPAEPEAVVAAVAAPAAGAGGEAKGKAAAKTETKATRRLEDVGPALRRDFDLQPQLTDPDKGAVVVDSETGRKVQLTQRSDDAGVRHTVRVGKVEAWSDGKDPFEGDLSTLSFDVPEGATDGPVTIECGDLTTQPYLAVRQQPVAEIAVRMRKGRRAVSLDAGRSADRGGGAVEQWVWSSNNSPFAEGERVGHVLSSARQVHGIALRVVDDDGDADVASMVSWRSEVRLRRPQAPRLPGALVEALGEPSSRLRLYVRAKASGQTTAALGKFKDRVGDELEARMEHRPDVQLYRVSPTPRCPRFEAVDSERRPAVRGFVFTDRVEAHLPPGCTPEEV